ncbi:MAG: sortase-associated OmpA-like protein PdsO [Glaciecola sp.]
MKKLILVSSITVAMTLGMNNAAVAANKSESDMTDAQKTEAIGFGSGFVTGALVGGPIGAIVGGTFGVLVAHDANTDDEIEAKNAEIVSISRELRQKEETIASVNRDLKSLQQKNMTQLVAYQENTDEEWLNDFNGFESNLQFKTASFLVEDAYKAQLKQVAALANTYPQLRIKLTGYADQRGDSQYNQQLSEQRAQAVKEFLLGNNVNASQIGVSGAGETTLTTQGKVNNEDLFFERRVSVTLVNSNKQMTAAN